MTHSHMGARPRGLALVVRRIVLALVLLFAFAVSQLTGWGVFSTNFADGAVRASVASATGATARDELERLRAAQKKVGLTRPPAQIEAEIDGLLGVLVRSQGKTVRDLTSDCAQPGFAPVTCRKVADLRAELAAAREAAGLPARIEAAAAKAKAAPQVAEGNPYLAFVGKVFGGAGPEEITFWLVLGFVFGIGAISNFGPGLLLAMGEAGDRHGAALMRLAWTAVLAAFAIEVAANSLFGYRIAGWPVAVGGIIIALFGAFAGYQLARTLAPAGVALAADAFGGLLPPPRQSPGGGAPAGGPAWGPPAGPGPGHVAAAGPVQTIIPPGAAHLTGAPINITVRHLSEMARSAAPAEAAAGPAPGTASPRGRDLVPATPRRAGAEAPGAPVNRARVQALIDMVLTFEAACLEPDDEGTVPAEDVYRAFVKWGRGRTLPIHTVIDLLDSYSAAARRVDVAGRVHFSGVRLGAVEPRRLRVVS